MLKEQLNNLRKDLKRRVFSVKDSNKESLKELKKELKYFKEYSEFSFLADEKSYYLIYNFIDEIDGNEYYQRVVLPDLFVENFEEFMSSSE